MATITVILADDLITDSRAVINTNFANLNSDKIETSYLDTDTTLAANSDVKIATQKAVKAYVDAGGNVNASETTRGIVEEATDAEVTAGTETGGTGAKLFITPAKLATRITTGISSPVTNVYSTVSTIVGGSTTRFDITNPSGTTFRYTYDGTGTDPSFSAANYPVGTAIYFNAQNFTAANNGVFLVTGSGTNYVEVTNASGVAENDKTIGTGYIYKGVVWTKPTGLKYVEVEVVGGGASSCQTGGNGVNSSGSSGGYARKRIAAASLGATVAIIVGNGGAAVASNTNSNPGRNSAFGSGVICTGAALSTHTTTSGAPGTATGGDVNINGQNGYPASSSAISIFGIGGSTPLGLGGIGNGVQGTGYGCGASGATSSGSSAAGNDGVVIVVEHYI